MDRGTGPALSLSSRFAASDRDACVDALANWHAQKCAVRQDYGDMSLDLHALSRRGNPSYAPLPFSLLLLVLSDTHIRPINKHHEKHRRVAATKTKPS